MSWKGQRHLFPVCLRYWCQLDPLHHAPTPPQSWRAAACRKPGASTEPWAHPYPGHRNTLSPCAVTWVSGRVVKYREMKVHGGQGSVSGSPWFPAAGNLAGISGGPVALFGDPLRPPCLAHIRLSVNQIQMGGWTDGVAHVEQLYALLLDKD